MTEQWGAAEAAAHRRHPSGSGIAVIHPDWSREPWTYVEVALSPSGGLPQTGRGDRRESAKAG